MKLSRMQNYAAILSLLFVLLPLLLLNACAQSISARNSSVNVLLLRQAGGTVNADELVKGLYYDEAQDVWFSKEYDILTKRTDEDVMILNCQINYIEGCK